MATGTLGRPMPRCVGSAASLTSPARTSAAVSRVTEPVDIPIAAARSVRAVGPERMSSRMIVE